MKKFRRDANRRWFVLIGVILCFASQACFSPAGLQVNDRPSARRAANLIPVPLTYQSYDYTCGVSALQSILYYYGKDFRHEHLAKALEPDPVKGTNYRRMAEFARSLGFRVDVLMPMSLEDLKKLIDERTPVIVLIQAWPDFPVRWRETWSEGHYTVAIGYDPGNIYFMDPSIQGHYAFIPIQEFLDRWHDVDDRIELNHFGMVIAAEGAKVYNPDVLKRLQ